MVDSRVHNNLGQEGTTLFQGQVKQKVIVRWVDGHHFSCSYFLFFILKMKSVFSLV